MSVTERAVVFDCAGEELVGVLSEPGAARRVGVLIVVGGWQYRVGSHRQFVLLARRLADQRIAVMRFDYRGMGDSGGPMRTFEHIEADIAAAIDAFRRACPAVEKVVLWGLCDAASASLMYWEATADTRICGMVMLNPWVLSDEMFARSQIKHHYLKRPLELDFWKKLMRGRVNFAASLQALAMAVSNVGSTSASDSYQTVMAKAMARFAGPILIILSGHDPTAKGFIEYCGREPRWRDLIDRPNVEQRSVPDADHTFSSAEWRGEVELATLDWLQRSFPEESAAPLL